MAIIKYTNVVDRLPDQAAIEKILAERMWDGMGRQAETSIEIQLTLYSHQGIIPGYTEYMVSKIPSDPKHPL